jgi:hypothetical protein
MLGPIETWSLTVWADGFVALSGLSTMVLHGGTFGAIKKSNHQDFLMRGN